MGGKLGRKHKRVSDMIAVERKRKLIMSYLWVQKSGGGANNNWFTPFGGGQRLCPGIELSRLELSIFLHHLVTTYR